NTRNVLAPSIFGNSASKSSTITRKTHISIVRAHHRRHGCRTEEACRAAAIPSSEDAQTTVAKGVSGGGVIKCGASSGRFLASIHVGNPSRQTRTLSAFETRDKIDIKSASEIGPTGLSPSA